MIGLMPNQFCVYTHSRPDGSIFYIGKGILKRATDFARSRRTAHHQNIVRKYGRANIIVQIIPCANEQEAFTRERAKISEHRNSGVELVNITDGGEGASGRKMTPEQLAQHREATRRGWDRRGRKPKAAFIPYKIECKQCGKSKVTKLKKTIFCSRYCDQRWRRGQRPSQPIKQYSNNSSGATGVYWNKREQRWIAMIGVHGKLVFLGYFDAKNDAITARKSAEKIYESQWNGGHGGGRKQCELPQEALVPIPSIPIQSAVGL